MNRLPIKDTQTSNKNNHTQQRVQNPLLSWSFCVWVWRFVWFSSAKILDFSSVIRSCLMIEFADMVCSFMVLAIKSKLLVISSWVCCSLLITPSKSCTWVGLMFVLVVPINSVLRCLSVDAGLLNSSFFSVETLSFAGGNLLVSNSSLTWLLYWDATLWRISFETESPYGEEQGDKNWEATTLSVTED